MADPESSPQPSWRRLRTGVLEMAGTMIRLRLIPSAQQGPFQIYLGEEKAPLGYLRAHTTLAGAKRAAEEFHRDLLEMGFDPSVPVSVDTPGHA